MAEAGMDRASDEANHGNPRSHSGDTLSREQTFSWADRKHQPGFLTSRGSIRFDCMAVLRYCITTAGSTICSSTERSTSLWGFV